MNREIGNLVFSLRGDWTRFVNSEWLAVAAIGGYFTFLPFETRPDLATFCLLLPVLLAVHSSSPPRPGLGRADRFIISVFLLATLFSTAFSSNPSEGLRYLFYACLNMLLLALASSLSGRRRVRCVVGWFGLVGVFHLVILLGSRVSLGDVGAQWIIGHAQVATLVVPNDALILGLCFPALAFALLRGGKLPHPVAWLLLIAYVGCAVYTSYFLQSKIALLSILISVLAYGLAGRVPSWRGGIRARETIAIVGLFALILLPGVLGWYFGNQSTTRLSLWAEAGTAHTTLSSLLFGAGPNSFVFNPFFAEWGFDRGNFIVPWVHNVFLEAYYEQGLLGLAGIVLLTVLPLLRALRVEDRRVRALILATMVVFVFVALFEVTLTRRFYFAALALFYGLSAAQTREVLND